MKPVAGAATDLVEHPEVHWPEVLADEQGQDLAGAARPAQPRGDRLHPLGPEPVVADEAGAAVEVDAARLRLRHVVHQDRQLPHFPAREAASHRLGERGRDPRVVRRQQAEMLSERIGSRERPERVLPHREAMRRRLSRGTHGGDLRKDHVEHRPRVGLANCGRAPRQPQDVSQLVPHPLPCDGHESGGRSVREPLGLRLDGEIELMGQPYQAEDAQRIVRECGGPARAKSTGGEIGEAAGRVPDRGGSLQQRGEIDGERVDGDVARRQVGLEGRSTEIGQIHVEGRRARQDDTRHAVTLAERDERASETLGQPAGGGEAARCQRQVHVAQRALEEQVPHRSADQPDRTVQGLQDRTEQRPDGIGARKGHRGRVGWGRHDSDQASDDGGGGDGAPIVSARP